jgi:5-hydroxyisourate hydrolase-like protein (transthyretin family)
MVNGRGKQTGVAAQLDSHILEMPQGRKLRSCDAVAVSIYAVDNSLLKAVFNRHQAEDGRIQLPALSLPTLQSFQAAQMKTANFPKWPECMLNMTYHCVQKEQV